MNEDLKREYRDYVVLCAEIGMTPVSYEEWLVARCVIQQGLINWYQQQLYARAENWRAQGCNHMQYLGGKSRTYKLIAGYLNMINPGLPYWEPFVGAAWVTQAIVAPRRYASDANVKLIAMWQELQRGWLPPMNVSEDEYKQAQRGEYPPHLEAFIRFGCSFGGQWSSGYARNNRGSNYASQSARSVLQKTLRL